MHIGNRYSVNICNDLENNVVELIVRWFCRLFWRKFSQRSETQSESSIISKKSFIAKIVKNFESLTICTKRFIENVWLNAPLGILLEKSFWRSHFLFTLSWRWSRSYRYQSIDLLCRSVDWFLYFILFLYIALFVSGFSIMKELKLNSSFTRFIKKKKSIPFVII